MVVQKASNTKQKILLDKQNYETKQTKVAFNCSVRPVGRDQSVLNGTHKFSDLVLTRLALLMDQKPLSSPAPVGKSAGILRVVTGKMYARALTLSIYTDQKTVLFGRPDETNGGDIIYKTTKRRRAMD